MGYLSTTNFGKSRVQEFGTEWGMEGVALLVKHIRLAAPTKITLVDYSTSKNGSTVTSSKRLCSSMILKAGRDHPDSKDKRRESHSN